MGAAQWHGMAGIMVRAAAGGMCFKGTLGAAPEASPRLTPNTASKLSSCHASRAALSSFQAGDPVDACDDSGTAAAMPDMAMTAATAGRVAMDGMVVGAHALQLACNNCNIVMSIFKPEAK